MFTSAAFVLKENINNFYRTYSIARYELLAEMRDSKLGLFWNFASPTIQVFTFWFVFGYVFDRKAVAGVPYIVWMLGGMVVWFFISPCITDGCNAIYSKSDVITKMKFPVSILPLTVVLKKLFNHLCLMVVVVIVFMVNGCYPSLHWLGLFYYLLCGVLFSSALSLTTSVLNMMARDVKKFIVSCMRMLMYLTPILWDISMLPAWLAKIVRCNPIYYVVQGYRDCFFYHKGIGNYTWSMAWFWGFTFLLFFIGSHMMYKFKTRFIDML